MTGGEIEARAYRVFKRLKAYNDDTLPMGWWSDLSGSCGLAAILVTREARAMGAEARVVIGEYKGFNHAYALIQSKRGVWYVVDPVHYQFNAEQPIKVFKVAMPKDNRATSYDFGSGYTVYRVFKTDVWAMKYFDRVWADGHQAPSEHLEALAAYEKEV